MDKILIDTSVIVRYLKSADGILADILGNGYKLAISSVSITELMATGRASNPEAHKKMEDFVNDNFEVIEISGEIANRAGDLIRQLDITLGQSCIAAVALEQDLPLLTYEFKIFDSIPDLKLIDL